MISSFSSVCLLLALHDEVETDYYPANFAYVALVSRFLSIMNLLQKNVISKKDMVPSDAQDKETETIRAHVFG